MNNTALVANRVLNCIVGMGCLLWMVTSPPGALGDSEAPPSPPLVATAPDPSAWTIEVKQKQSGPAPSDDDKQKGAYKRLEEIYPRITSITVEKAGGNKREETVYENGKKATICLYKGWVLYHFVQFPPDKVVAVSASDRNSPVKVSLLADFPDVSWIRPEVFVKTVTYRKQRCFYYEDKDAAPLTGGNMMADPVKGVRAWINAETRLPVAVQDATMLKIFTFAKKPPESIELGDNFAKAYESTVGSPK